MVNEKCFWKYSRDWLVCLLAFVGIFLLSRLPNSNSLPLLTYIGFVLSLLTCFSEFVFPHSSQLSWNGNSANNLFNFWFSKIQQANTHKFCSWDGIFMQNWSSGFPNSFRKCTESPSKQSTNTLIEWNLYLSWRKHLLGSFF